MSRLGFQNLGSDYDQKVKKCLVFPRAVAPVDFEGL